MSPARGLRYLKILSIYDLFQYENKLKPDYCNMGGVVFHAYPIPQRTMRTTGWTFPRTMTSGKTTWQRLMPLRQTAQIPSHDLRFSVTKMPGTPMPTLCGVLTQIDNATTVTTALRARVTKLETALIEVGDFLADDCIENYPFDRIPGSFADEADRLLKLIKASVGDTPQ